MSATRQFMTIALAQDKTKRGDRFWRVVDKVSGRPLSPPIWSGEIEWFVESLEAIALGLDVGAFLPVEGAYPLAVRIHGLHAVVLLLANSDPEPHLQIERWKGFWMEKATAGFRILRYFGPENRA